MAWKFHSSYHHNKVFGCLTSGNFEICCAILKSVCAILKSVCAILKTCNFEICLCNFEICCAIFLFLQFSMNTRMNRYSMIVWTYVHFMLWSCLFIFQNVHPTFMRTVPPYFHQALAWVDILRHFNWSQVIFVHGMDEEGRAILSHFQSLAEPHEIKVCNFYNWLFEELKSIVLETIAWEYWTETRKRSTQTAALWNRWIRVSCHYKIHYRIPPPR
mgnify:FL=1